MRSMSAVAVFALSVVSIACAPPIEPESWEAAIVNGVPEATNQFSVAIYHRVNGDSTCSPPYPQNYAGWIPIPCTGTIIRRATAPLFKTYVLTARHCVTLNGLTNGPLVGAQHLALSVALSPGPLPPVVGTSPPPSFVFASVFAAGNPTSSFDIGEDLAILEAEAPLIVSNPTRFGVFHGPVNELFGNSVRAYGYGLSNTSNCNLHAGGFGGTTVPAGTTSGVLRSAAPFPIVSSSAKSYALQAVINGNQRVGVTDAGGGSFLTGAPFLPGLLAGVHSTAGLDAGGANLANWIQSRLGTLFLMSRLEFDNTNRLVGVSSVSSGALVRYDHLNEETNATRIGYVPATGQLRIGGIPSLCIQDNGLFAQVSLAACSSASNQQWTLKTDSQIQKNGTNRCLATNTGMVTTGFCGSITDSQWIWLTQSSP